MSNIELDLGKNKEDLLETVRAIIKVTMDKYIEDIQENGLITQHQREAIHSSELQKEILEDRFSDFLSNELTSLDDDIEAYEDQINELDDRLEELEDSIDTYFEEFTALATQLFNYGATEEQKDKFIEKCSDAVKIEQLPTTINELY